MSVLVSGAQRSKRSIRQSKPTAYGDAEALLSDSSAGMPPTSPSWAHFQKVTVETLKAFATDPPRPSERETISQPPTDGLQRPRNPKHHKAEHDY